MAQQAPTAWYSKKAGHKLDIWMRRGKLTHTGSQSFVAADKSGLRIPAASQTDLAPGTGDFTIAFSVYPTSVPSAGNLRVIVDYGGTGGGNRGVLIRQNADNNLRVDFNDGNGTSVTATMSSKPLTLNAWNTCVATFNRSGNCTVTIEGTQAGTLDISSKTGDITAGDMDVGALNNVTSDFIDGRLDTLVIDHALWTAAEVAAYHDEKPTYASVGSGSFANVMQGGGGWWDMDELSNATTFADAHGGNDLSFASAAMDINGGFEDLDAADDFSLWNEIESGTSTVNDETTIVHTGSHACRFDVDSSNNLVRVRQILTVNKTYDVSLYTRCGSGQTATLSIYNGAGVQDKSLSDSTFEEFAVEHDAGGSGIFELRRGSGSNSANIYIDDVVVTAKGLIAAPGVAESPPEDTQPIEGVVDSKGGFEFSEDEFAFRPTFNADDPSATFDGVDDKLVHGTAILTGTEGVLYPAIETGDTVAAEQDIFSSADESVANTYLSLGINSSGQPRIKHNDGGTVNEVRGSTTLSTNSKAVIAYGTDGSTWFIYVNGVKETLTVVTGTNTGAWFGDLSGLDNVAVGARKAGSVAVPLGGKVWRIPGYDAANHSDDDVKEVSEQLMWDVGMGGGVNHYWTSRMHWLGVA